MTSKKEKRGGRNIIRHNINSLGKEQKKKMEESAKKEQGKKKITEVKTFSVPSISGVINENLTINTNTKTQLSKEQIIDQAFKFHSQGNILEAAKLYQYFIKREFTDPRMFCNFGIILEDLGKIKEAFNCYIKTIAIEPNYPNIYPKLK